MSANKTPNLNLHSWVGTDQFKMSEFNENFAALDAAVEARARVSSGSYVGTGTYGSANPCRLTFPFAPTFIVCAPTQEALNFNNAGTYSRQYCFLLADMLTTEYRQGMGFGSRWEDAFPLYARRSADGKTVEWYHTQNAAGQYNNTGTTYYWFAIG